jgi:RNA polymerase sigma factor (sigma-70 family)
MSSRPLQAVVRHIQHVAGYVAGGGLKDRQLLERFARQHDEDAFAELVRRHGPLVHGVCRRVLGHDQDAEDSFQATFLVLARKAGSVRWQDSVHGWLYGVAHQMAKKAKRARLRRRVREIEARRASHPSPSPHAAMRELSAVLDEELRRLPARYREPLLLCYLQGMTRDQAARQLSMPLRTLERRLAQGREVLRARLVRRGLSLSAAMVAASLIGETASAALPPLLLTSTVRNASLFATSSAVGAIPSRVTDLAGGLLKVMAVAKLKGFGAVLIAVGLAAVGGGVGGGALLYHAQIVKAENNGWQSDDQPKQAEEPGQLQGTRVAVFDSQMKPAINEVMHGSSNDSAKSPSPTKDATSGTKRGSWPRKFSGRVTDSDGHPIGQTKILLVGPFSYAGGTMPVDVREVARSDARGDFAFELMGQTAEEQRLDEPGGTAVVVAQASGYGLASLTLEAFDSKPVDSSKRKRVQSKIDQDYGAGRFAERTLKLRPEQPIHGRLLDLEGRPLTNVMVSAESISEVKIETLLKAFEQSDKRLTYQSVIPIQISLDPLQRLFPSVKTDSFGRFTFRGVGKDQLLTLTFQREGVEAARIYVVGRKMQPARLPQIEHYSDGYQDFYGGCDFTYALGPSAPVIGVVKDCDTGQPIPNTIVFVERLFAERGEQHEKLRLSCRYIRTTTDKQGSFRMVGIPPGGPHILRAVPPIQEPYLMAEKEISPKLDGSPGAIDILVKKGLWYEGRVTDKASGKPVRAHVDHLALRSNPNKLDNFGLRQGWEMGRYPTDNDGRYRTLGLPGPGVLLIRAMELDSYPRAIGGDKVPGYRASINYIPTTPTGMPLVNWNLIIQVDPPKTAVTFHRDIILDAGETIPGRLVAPDGRPLSDVQVVGETLNKSWWEPHTNAEFQLKGYDGKGPRQLLFRASESSLVGKYRLEGPAPKEILVKLEPAVRVRGRLIERETDLPAERCEIYCENSTIGEAHITASTDDAGRFEIKGLVAGAVYKMSAANSRGFFSNKNKFEIDLKQARPGDVIDLGDIGRPTSKKP